MEETNPESHGKLVNLECWNNSVCNVESNSSDVCDSGVEILRDMSIVNKVSLESSFASDQENMNETVPREKRKRKQLSKSTPEQKENSITSPSHDVRPKDIFFAGGFAIHRRKKTSLSSGKDAFAVLSDEMVIQVFRWLPKATLRNCAQVSRRWNRLSGDESLWSRIDLGGSGRTLLPDALSHVLSRGVQVLRLASSEIPDPVFDIHSKFVMENEISKVQYLDLSMANISRDGVAKLLGSCRHLRKLSLEQNQLGDESCIAIGKNENLEVVNLCSCSGITEVGMKSILTGCVRLVLRLTNSALSVLGEIIK
ncbi:hypothetical protein J437_LFUL016710 [Ladona fulva]|uniref:F-box domain-containing protein n=1 Tax=Ladona fulva TaxID=123851 RepID=A0A8K0KME0_LADFU|nr:hypothetical protein J437_LFUL016710 [Ladona fulva]